MIPLHDDIPHQKLPIVTATLIAVNAAIFLFNATMTPDELAAFFFRFAFHPAKLFRPEEVVAFYRSQFGLRVPGEYGLVESLYPAFTCMFLHGGWLHVIGNMWMLWIFGDNVEDGFGHVGFLLFYLTCGLASSVAQAVSAPLSPVPMVGASGAIAGVMGAYMFLYPRARVLTVVWIIFLIDFWPIPAFIFLFYWFAIQVFSGVGTLAAGGMGGGVAWWAHIGGFVMGFVLVVATGVRPPPRERHGYGHVGYYLDPRTGRLVARRPQK